MHDKAWEESQSFLKALEKKYEAETFDELLDFIDRIESDLYQKKSYMDFLRLEKVIYLYHLKNQLIDFEVIIDLEPEELEKVSFELETSV